MKRTKKTNTVERAKGESLNARHGGKKISGHSAPSRKTSTIIDMRTIGWRQSIKNLIVLRKQAATELLVARKKSRGPNRILRKHGWKK